MRFLSPLVIGLAVTPAWAQYSRPTVVSQNPATTFQDNLVGPHVEVPISPLQTLVKSPLPKEYTGVVNVRRGSLELRYFNSTQGQHNLVDETRIPVGATSYVQRPGTWESWVLAPNARTDVDAATGLPHHGGVITIIDAFTGVPSRQIAVGKGPSGIVFHPSGDVAWVTCRYSKDVHVIDAINGVSSATIPLDQFTPHAIDFNPATNEVLVASLLSGNNTSARGLSAGDGIPDVITYLPTDPQAVNPLPDRDVVVLNVDPNNPLNTTIDASDARLATGVMTIQYNLTVNPHASEAYVVGTEALNANFVGEKNAVQGGVVENRLVRLDYSAGGAPTKTTVVLDGLAVGPMATPTDFVFSPTDANRGWLVARGVDRVVEFNLSGPIPVAIGAYQIVSGDANFTGPLVGARLAEMHADGTQLTVWCEIESSFAVIDVTSPPVSPAQNVSTTALSYDPLPASVKRGWGHASDARRSANASTSCASCHVDGGNDGLLWDLSKWHDKEFTPSNQLAHEEDNKGPMLTQVLFGLNETGPFHWRGEQENLRAFNGTFPDLMEGAPLTSAELDDLVAYMGSLQHAPNPHQSIDRSYANTPSPNGLGNVQAGLNDFRTFPVYGGNNTATCSTCHTLPTGTNNQIQNLGALVGPPSSAVQVAQLRGVGNRLDENFTIGGWYGDRSRNGTGLTHAAAESSFEHFVANPAFPGLQGSSTQSTRENLVAYLDSFDTGLAPSTGFVRVLRADSADPVGDFNTTMAFVSAQANAGHADFSALLSFPNGTGFVRYPLFFDISLNAFVLAAAVQPSLFPSMLQNLAQTNGRTLTIFGHPAGSGHRWSIDADDDQLLDWDEAFVHGSDPFNPDTDGDTFPDGHELANGNSITMADTTSNDVTPPAITATRVMIATTNTVKVEFNLNEVARVRTMLESTDPSGVLFDFQTNDAQGPGVAGFARSLQVTASLLPSQVETPLFALPVLGLQLLPVKFVATDPAGKSTTVFVPILMGPRDQALRVQDISNAAFVAPLSATFDVQLLAGTLPALTVPFLTMPVVPGLGLPPAIPASMGNPAIPEPVWDLRVLVSYGTQPGGPGTQIFNLTKLVGPGPNGTFLASQSNSSGSSKLTVPLPASAATDSNRVLAISVDDVIFDSTSGGSLKSRGFSYIETQAYKRHHQVLAF